MDNNCLVTKLKGVVDNDNLPLLGVFILKRKAFRDGDTSVSALRLQASKDITVSVKEGEGGYFATTRDDLINLNTVTSILIPANQQTYLYFHNSNYNIYIEHKNSINDFYISGDSSNHGKFEFSINDLASFEELSTFRSVYHYASGNVSYLPDSDMREFTCVNTPQVVGDFACFGKYPNISICTIYGTGITGSIESFVQEQINHGRLSVNIGDLASREILDNVTFGGSMQEIGNYMCWLRWESNNKMFVYVADNISYTYNYSHITTIFAKGATQAEIDAFETDGKTVVVVDS